MVKFPISPFSYEETALRSVSFLFVSLWVVIQNVCQPVYMPLCHSDKDMVTVHPAMTYPRVTITYPKKTINLCPLQYFAVLQKFTVLLSHVGYDMNLLFLSFTILISLPDRLFGGNGLREMECEKSWKTLAGCYLQIFSPFPFFSLNLFLYLFKWEKTRIKANYEHNSRSAFPVGRQRE